MLKSVSKRFFFEKKKQKTFFSLGLGIGHHARLLPASSRAAQRRGDPEPDLNASGTAAGSPMSQRNQSFFGSFCSQKEHSFLGNL
jgi:hypothetical protein